MSHLIRALVFIVALTGQTHAKTPHSNVEADFCTRLGRTIGLDEAKLADGRAGWQANALNFGQRFLVGGTALTSVAVELPESATIDDYKRAEGMCMMEGKAAVCRLTGPIDFKFGWKGNTTITPVMGNEKAIVRVDGTKAFCEMNMAD